MYIEDVSIIGVILMLYAVFMESRIIISARKYASHPVMPMNEYAIGRLIKRL